MPAGQAGARLLVTNLHNRVQPLLRLEVTDLVTLDPDPCRCGRSLVRASAIHGRSDDPLETHLGQAVTRQLLKLGVHDPRVTVERRHQLSRSAGGKLKLVIADQTPSAVAGGQAKMGPT